MRFLILGLAGLSLGACASAPGTTSENDPYEGFNRSMLSFNLALDEAVIEPVSDGYVAVTPKWGRDRVSDFFQNLREPVTFVNDVLQGEGERALQTGFRFSLNSTLGLAGLFDIAAYEGLEAHKEDFGQTLAVWGVDSGPYLVMPFLGPTNPRDLTGFGVDRAFNPNTYIQFDSEEEAANATRVGLMAARGLAARSGASNQIEALRKQPEPYVALRTIYTESRDTAIRNGIRQEEQDLFQELSDFEDN